MTLCIQQTFLLVFVLMNYVNYLYAMVVEAPEEFMASVPIENSAGADAGEDAPVEIRIYVKQAGDRIVYTFADEDTRELSLAELTAGLESRTAAAMPGAMIKVFIHASGDVMFQHVFNASFPAWKLGKGGTGQRTGALNLDVHLVYEERQPDK